MKELPDNIGYIDTLLGKLEAVNLREGQNLEDFEIKLLEGYREVQGLGDQAVARLVQRGENPENC
jgi:hypothetical protein